MAEGETTFDLTMEVESKEKGDLECAVCLQTCIHPAQLPCGHIFCFLCIKGIANQSKKCAMCRQEIPRDFIEHPNLLQTETLPELSSPNHDGTYQWFYEGRNGWWQYDERTSKELEESYKAGEKLRELLIAGFLYVADMEAMLQIRRNDPSRRRRIKRDLATIPKKGIAGLRTEPEPQIQDQENTEALSNDDDNPPTEGNSIHTPTTPLNTPPNPSEERELEEEELEATIERIGDLTLEEHDEVRHVQRRVRIFDV